jgi:predicted transcriptional regulator
MQTSVLLSIKPEFAEKILSGQKRYEFRRVLFKSKSVSRIFIYASSPVQRIVGEFEIEEILELSKRRLWKRTSRHSGINKAYFDKYFAGSGKAFAIKVCRPLRYSTPIPLRHICDTDRPPQSFMYLELKAPSAALLKAA